MLPEHEETVLALLEQFGEIKSPRDLADYLGVSNRHMVALLKSNKAKAAAAKFCPASKKHATLDVESPSTDQDPALLDDSHGYQIFDPAPGGTFYLKRN